MKRSAEQDLTNSGLESRIDSSLLCTREDGTQDFVHDSYKSFFIAKWFANRINDGRLSVEEAYKKYWSYEEDAELWNLPKDREWRALLPAWKNVLLHTAVMLDNDKAKDLVDAISKYHINFRKLLGGRNYDPFADDFFLAISNTHISSKKDFPKIESPRVTEDEVREKKEDTLTEYTDPEDLWTEDFELDGYENEGECDDPVCLMGLYLDSIQSKKAMDRLVSYLSDLRSDEVGFEDLVDYLSHDSNPRINDVAEAIVERNENGVVNELVKYIRNLNKEAADTAWSVIPGGYKREIPWYSYQREDAIRALSRIPSDTAKKALIEYLIDPANPQRDFAANILSTERSRKIILTILSLPGEAYNGYMSEVVHSIHQRLKPQGYNPPVKRLVA